MIIVLPGKAMPVTNEKFVKIFGGGADCYLPDFIGRDGSALNIFCLIIGAAALCSASVLHIPQLILHAKRMDCLLAYSVALPSLGGTVDRSNCFHCSEALQKNKSTAYEG